MYTLETFSESRRITIKDIATFDITKYGKKTSFNIIFITSDNMILLAERKFSYYLDAIYIITKDIKITDAILRNFLYLFTKLNIMEKYYIIKKKNMDIRYKYIIDFINTHFDGNLKSALFKMKINLHKVDLMLFNDDIPYNFIKNYEYFTKVIIKNSKNIISSNFKKNSKTFVLPGGKKDGNETIDCLIKRETNEEVNLNLSDLNLFRYFSETIIYDKIIYKTFLDITFISSIPYSSKDIIKLFKPNREISNIRFIPFSNFRIDITSYNILLYLIQYILIM